MFLSLPFSGVVFVNFFNCQLANIEQVKRDTKTNQANLSRKVVDRLRVEKGIIGELVERESDSTGLDWKCHIES